MRAANFVTVHRTSLFWVMPKRGGRNDSGLYGAEGRRQPTVRAGTRRVNLILRLDGAQARLRRADAILGASDQVPGSLDQDPDVIQPADVIGISSVRLRFHAALRLCQIRSQHFTSRETERRLLRRVQDSAAMPARLLISLFTLAFLLGCAETAKLPLDRKSVV